MKKLIKIIFSFCGNSQTGPQQQSAAQRVGSLHAEKKEKLNSHKPKGHVTLYFVNTCAIEQSQG